MNDALTGHEMLNHLGRRIRVTARTLRGLDMHGFLARDRASGLLAFKSKYFQLWRALEPGNYGELGPDMSGPASIDCRCHECMALIGDIDHTRRPGRDALDQVLAEQVVQSLIKQRHGSLVAA